MDSFTRRKFAGIVCACVGFHSVSPRRCDEKPDPQPERAAISLWNCNIAGSLGDVPIITPAKFYATDRGTASVLKPFHAPIIGSAVKVQVCFLQHQGFLAGRCRAGFAVYFGMIS
jgi:hypothetical protein